MVNIYQLREVTVQYSDEKVLFVQVSSCSFAVRNLLQGSKQIQVIQVSISGTDDCLTKTFQNNTSAALYVA